MKKVIVIGCPGGGKSTFSRNLSRMTSLPLFYLDMIYHKPDRTTYTREEFDQKLFRIMAQEEWILDGNFARTLPVRLKQCDTVFWLDYPLEVCLSGIESRRGKPREDMPWVETEPDEEFIEYIRNFQEKNKPEMERLLRQAEGKEIYVFKSRDMADRYLSELEMGLGAGEQRRNWNEKTVSERKRPELE